MKEQIAKLRKIQELVLTRDEHRKAGDGSRLEELDGAIASLQDSLDPAVSALYSRLYKKNHVVLAAMSNGCCSACGMQVPIAQGQQVRLVQHLVTCSSCGRILFAEDAAAARNVSASISERDDDKKTGLARFSDEALVCEIDGTDRAGAIEKLAGLMESNSYISNASSLVSAALDREAILSTAVDGGLAFPHVRGVEGGRLVMAVGVSKNGIDWDGTKVNIVFLSAIPVAVSDFYIRLMSGIMQAFSKKEAIEAAVKSKDSPSLWKTLLKATRTTVK